jgi:hypothetical protein
VLNAGLARGAWLNPGTAREPVAVLGWAAAQRLGIDRIFPDQRIWLGGQWFNVAGILESSPLEPDIDNSALIGYPAAQRYLGYISLVQGERKAGPPSSIYVRADTDHVAEAQALLAPTANPQAADEVNVSQPYGHLRQLEELAHRDPRRSMDGRHRVGDPDRRGRRPDAGHPSVPPAAHRGIANGMSGKRISIGRPPCARAFAVSVAPSSAARLDIQPPRRSLVQAQPHSGADPYTIRGE